MVARLAKGAGMKQLIEARRRLSDAGTLPAVLGAALDAFEAMFPVLHQQEDRAGPGFAAFALAAASAGSGRDAVAFAPSLPSAGPGLGDAVLSARPAEVTEAEAAGELAALAQALAERLEDAAAGAADPADRQACQDGARHAARITALLTGTADS